MTTSPATARHARAEAIRAGALVRAALGLDAGHLLLPDGRHQVSVIDRAARKVRTFIGCTVEEAIEEARKK